MKRVLSVVLALVMLIGLLSVGVFAATESYDVNFNYYYGGWTQYESSSGVWRLFMEYSPSVGTSPYWLRTKMLREVTDQTYAAGASTVSDSGYTNSGWNSALENNIYVLSDYIYGDIGHLPTSNAHSGVRYNDGVSMVYKSNTY